MLASAAVAAGKTAAVERIPQTANILSEAYTAILCTNKNHSYRRDSALRRSLRRSGLCKVADVNINRKAVCDFLLVNNANLHHISVRFQLLCSSGQILPLTKDASR